MADVNYTYEILQYRPEDLFLQVRYSAEGRKSLIRNLMPPQVDPANVEADLDAFIRANVPIRVWNRIAAVSGVDASAISKTPKQATYEPPPAPAEPSVAEQAAAHLANVAARRFEKEQAGIVWQSGADTFYVDTSLDSQQRLAAAKIAADTGMRRDNAVWKMGKFTPAGTKMVFHPLSNASLAHLAQAVLDHVQKCFDAEDAATRQIESFIADGNYAAALAVDYDAVFDSM